MQDVELKPLTAKGVRTREHLYTTALHLFIEKGYTTTTMRDIATAAECSLGLTYRYFASKDELVLELYHRMAVEMEAEVVNLPRRSLADRFVLLMEAKFAQLAPHRPLLAILLGPALNPQDGVAVLGTQTGGIRERSASIFQTVVAGASDAPRNPLSRDLGTILYAAHLGLILFWLYDRSPNQRATMELLRLAHDVLALTRRLLRLPPLRSIVHRIAQIIEPVFGPTQ